MMMMMMMMMMMIKSHIPLQYFSLNRAVLILVAKLILCFLWFFFLIICFDKTDLHFKILNYLGSKIH